MSSSWATCRLRLSDEQLSGTEGAVWCVTEPSGRVTLWKCKPESIEEIHWATGINKQAVLATCWNALETVDVLSFETVRPLLLEEYEPEDVDAFRPHVEACIAAAAGWRVASPRLFTLKNECDRSSKADDAFRERLRRRLWESPWIQYTTT